jgi:hypothetical protein
MGIPAGVLANIKAKQTVSRFTALAEVHRSSQTRTATGGTAITWTPVATGVAIGIAAGPSGQGQEQQAIISRFGSAVGFYLLFPAGFDIRDEDRVYQTMPQTRTFEVIALPNAGISYETMRRVLGVVAT